MPVEVSKDGLALEAQSWSAKARGLRIIDRETYLNASHLLQSVKGLRNEIGQWFAPFVDAAMDTKRKAEAARKGLTDEQARMEAPLLDAETFLKGSLLEWEGAQERIRQERQAALQIEAQRQAEESTLAAAAALEIEAVATGDAGMLQEAHDILTQPIDAPVVSVATLMPKVHGISYRDHWKAHDEIDIKALAAAVAAGQVAPTFLIPNMPALQAFARATKGLQPVPGVKFWNDRIVAARA